MARLTPLGDWLQSFRPDCKVITMARKDLDLLQRWPQTAFNLFQVTTINGVTHWRGFELRGDRTVPRYPPASDDYYSP